MLTTHRLGCIFDRSCGWHFVVDVNRFVSFHCILCHGLGHSIEVHVDLSTGILVETVHLKIDTQHMALTEHYENHNNYIVLVHTICTH